MSSNIPEARARIETVIGWLRSEDGMPVNSCVRELRRALKVMTRKPRKMTAEPKARKPYMTKAVLAEIAAYTAQNPGMNHRHVARVFGTDPDRTKRAMETGK